MYKIMYKFFFILLLLTSSQNVLAQQTTIYRWIDSNNVVHFSHEHPKDKDYAQIDVKTSYASVVRVPKGKPETAKQVDPVSTSSTDIFSDNCTLAKENLTTLHDHENIMLKDIDGSEKLLSKAEKKKQIKLSEKRVELYCELDNLNK